MSKGKGFTLIELLIVISAIAILLVMAVSAFNGMRGAAKLAKAQGDLRVLKLAIESYYNNYDDKYPSGSGTSAWENNLTSAYPKILSVKLYDPFAPDNQTSYQYALTNARYFIVWSVGPNGNGSASISSSGTITASNDAIWESNGH